MSFLSNIFSSNDGLHRNSFVGDLGNRAGALISSGGLSGFSDLSHDFKQAFGNGGDPGHPVGDAYAALTRDQWQTYVQNFVPVENKLISYATDPSVVTNAMSSASKDVTGAFDASQASGARRLRGMGLSLDTDEQKSADKSFGLAKSLADVGAQNTARDATVQRQQSIIGNPAPQAITI